MTAVDPLPSRIVVVGAGMVAHRFVESLLSRTTDPWHVTVLGEERRLPYDRVGLTSFFSGATPDDLTLDPGVFDDDRVELLPGEPVIRINRAERTVTTAARRDIPYDTLVLATGSYAAKVAVDGSDLPGCFVYRTIDDVQRMRDFVAARSAQLGRPLVGKVIGGGLLGLEAAGALQGLDVACTVVQSSDRLMSAQLDLAGGNALRRLIEARGIEVLTQARTTRLDPDRSGSVAGLEFQDGSYVGADIVVFTVGVRPRDELARAAGLPADPRGGVVIDDRCRTADPSILAIGEVASFDGQCIGLVAPGYAMAEVAATRLLGGDATFPGFDDSTKLKLSGVDVASFGDAFARTPGALDVSYADPVAGVYKKLVLSDDAKTLLGGILVGDASAYGSLRPLLGSALGADPVAYLMPEGGVEAPGGDLPDEAIICSCSSVTAGRIRSAVHDDGCTDAGEVKACTKAGATCGSCLTTVKKIVGQELAKMGQTVSNALCEHFDMSRRQLFDAVRVSGLDTFSAVIERFGRGRGCDICKPALASILSVLVGRHVLDGENATLQDTNDHVMANMQKDGTYSVVPRMPGGEVTPEGLIAVGEIARDFGLYTKITGGQRVDMFGARLEQLPAIWARLIDAGFESGHAYGKSLRTVKSCVGSTWCRYGVLDSVGMAVQLELRYRGLRAPHKLKLGVSGCARECAEARGKDVGVIATETGWNMYVGGNGGFTPRHAQLLAEGLSDAELLTAIDRFFMYYIRTADRLQRTAPWFEELEGGIEGLREVIFEDSLGICADLDAAMAAHIDNYEDEWAATLRDPEKLKRFQSFVNAPDTPDPSIAFVPERGQIRPASPEERAAGGVLIAGTTLEVRR
ncbi:nitrite reductase large subunit [Microbacterium barkeri]|uniref:assimilatory sulfite reductase (ferredoxin) n=1 Tax=Microbacterium barkeri TaxID=33917 RepID=A0A9W6LV57_9MICO|nr:nitrite reductase large subunit NirB [Microbacterium barkeri]MDI6942006.1 nitrite reductase large subunit NirB [Microbacterium barkeri]MDR6875879.1 nitrite reductase (NADH) large subunit [Microbacterium barkeri]GLJ59997.1 nitrite reductase large subunit [Microbacterium barkeri]